MRVSIMLWKVISLTVIFMKSMRYKKGISISQSWPLCSRRIRKKSIPTFPDSCPGQPCFRLTGSCRKSVRHILSENCSSPGRKYPDPGSACTHRREVRSLCESLPILCGLCGLHIQQVCEGRTGTVWKALLPGCILCAESSGAL